MSKTSTTHTPITDAMVERAFAFGIEKFNWSSHSKIKGELRRVLEVALNPPPEPEIPVSEEMIDAAVRVGGNAPDTYAMIYRAMELARRAESPTAAEALLQAHLDRSATWHANNIANQSVSFCPDCGVGSHRDKPVHIITCPRAGIRC